MKNIIAMCSKMHHNDKPKWNVIIAKLPYVMWTYHIKRNWDVIKSEEDLGLLQHPRWSSLLAVSYYNKVLCFGCCSSPRSAFENIIHNDEAKNNVVFTSFSYMVWTYQKITYISNIIIKSATLKFNMITL